MDVANGRVLTGFVDIELPGPLPLKIEHRFGDGTDIRNWFDNVGRLLKRRDRRRRTSEFVRDSEGRLLEARSPGETWRMRYDREGCLEEADNGSRRIQFRYGHFYRLLERTEAGARVKYSYDSEGRLTTVTDEGGNRWLRKYDAAGAVVEEQEFDQGTRRYQRDAAGRVVRITRPSGRTAEYSYDEADRPVAIRYSDGEVSELVYAPDGRLESSLGARQAIARDPFGRVDKVYHGPASDSHGQEIAFLRDGAGLETGRHLPGGVELRWTRDQAGRPVQRLERRVVEDRSLTLDRHILRWRGLSQMAELVDDTRGSTQYEHDAWGRLSIEHGPDGTVDRRLDLVGNVALDDWVYGDASRLLATNRATYEYDADGNRTAKLDRNGSRWSYVWNAAGLLREVVRPDGKRVRFAYDALGRRVRKTIVEEHEGGRESEVADVRFIWDGSRVCHEISSTNGVTTWYWDPDSFAPLGKEQARSRQTIVTDHLGPPTEMFDEHGRKVWSARLNAMGALSVECGATGDCPWRWPGQYHDQETNLYYNNFRYYAPETGQYISADRLGVLSAMRRHAYVPDPRAQIDPYGLNTLIVGGIGGGPGTVTSGQAESTRGPGDVTLNNDPKANPMVLADISQPTPLPDESFDRVFFENVGLREATPGGGAIGFGAELSALDEAHRLLKPDGSLRIQTPGNAPIDAIEQRLKDLGFTDIQITKPGRYEIEAKKGSCP